jgi:ATP-dependent Clp protease ATP-binding subunit ClpA
MTANVDPEFSTINNSPTLATSGDLISRRSQGVGQSTATKAIIPYVYMYQSGLASGRTVRRAWSCYLGRPTGTGKTKTVEAIAELLHGSEKEIVKLDCGGFQMEHEMAKLIGALRPAIAKQSPCSPNNN